MRFVKTYDELLSFIGNMSLYCYGNGDVGRSFFEFCKRNHIAVGGFIVSDDNNKKQVSEIETHTLSDVLYKINIAYNIKILVTTTSTYHAEIIDYMVSNGIPEQNIAVLYDMVDLKNFEYIKEVERRKRLSIFEYQQISADLDFADRTHTISSYFYGSNFLVKRALGLSSVRDINGIVEHGYRGMDNLILKYEIDEKNQHGDTIYVSSNERKLFLEKHLPSKKIVSVGIYMKYADNLIEKHDFQLLKKYLGRTLLVFPYHSTLSFDCDFAPRKLMEEVKRVKHNYDTILICMYWVDIQSHNYEYFNDIDCKIVTAGNIYDYYFLFRLKTLIELSDMTISNSIGSQTSYCVYLIMLYRMILSAVSKMATHQQMITSTMMK